MVRWWLLKWTIALLLKDLVLRSRYLAPGYLSCGGKPCQYDEMSEDDFRAIGKRKKRSGFKGTMRCYLDKCYGIHLVRIMIL